jgi:hypothetical protein
LQGSSMTFTWPISPFRHEIYWLHLSQRVMNVRDRKLNCEVGSDENVHACKQNSVHLQNTLQHKWAPWTWRQIRMRGP